VQFGGKGGFDVIRPQTKEWSGDGEASVVFGSWIIGVGECSDPLSNWKVSVASLLNAKCEVRVKKAD